MQNDCCSCGSRGEKSFSVSVVEHLKRLEYKVLQINPKFETCESDQFRSVDELPDEKLHLLILTPKSETLKVLQEAISKGITSVWIQQTCDTPEVLKLGFESGIKMVHGECIFMFSKPEGFHKFHYAVKSFFGGAPKNGQLASCPFFKEKMIVE